MHISRASLPRHAFLVVCVSGLVGCGADAPDRVAPDEALDRGAPSGAREPDLASDKADGALGVDQWMVMGQGVALGVSPAATADRLALQSSYRAEITNLVTGKVMGYMSRDYGINLGWYSERPLMNMAFERAGGGTILNCDEVAIRAQQSVTTAKYVMYGDREYGINLVWSVVPVYEWRIQAPGKACGVPIHVGALYDPATTRQVLATGPYDRFSLFNTRHARYVVYGSRAYGINLVWY